MIIEYIQSLLLIIAAIMIVIAAIGLVSLKDSMKNVVYARIHIVGLFDIACIIALIGLGQYLLAGIYIILAPFTAHAIGRSHLFEDDSFVPADEIKNRLKDPSFIHPINEFRKTSESPEVEENDVFSISKIDIVEE